MEREMKQDAVSAGTDAAAEKKREVAVVTIVTKAPKGYRPRQSVSRWVVISDWPKIVMRAAIDKRCREMARDLDKETGARFKVSWTVSYVSGLLGVSFLDPASSSPDAPQPSAASLAAGEE